MPRYDVRCRTCGSTFEVTRSMTSLDEPAPCPDGHLDTVRLLRTVAVTGVASGARAKVAPGVGSSGSAGSGCCGGGCCG
jgi:putative FmdB family regulatory protein